MKQRLITCLLMTGLVAGTAVQVHAAGFNIYEAGVRATALGCAFTATADDGSALFYNPAGLSFIEGRTANVNFMSVAPRFKFTGATTPGAEPATAEAEHKGYFLPGMFYTQNNGGKWSWGAGLYAPFGLGVEWMDPENFVGRQVSYDVSIQTIYVTPAVSYKVTEELALSLGADVAFQNLKLQKYLLNPTDGSNAIDTTIEGHSKLNFTPAVGAMYRPTEQLSFGLMYHHEKTMEFEGQDATLEDASDGGSRSSYPTNLLASLGGSEHEVASELNLPNILSLGTAFQFTDRLRAECNYVWFGWSTFEKLELEFDEDPESALNQEIHFAYEDAWQIRFGVNYELLPDRFQLMGGYVYDTTPQPPASISPLLPDSDRNDFSFGCEILGDAWDVNFAYMVVLGDERTNIENGEPANPDPAYPVGTYKTLAHIVGLGATYDF